MDSQYAVGVASLVGIALASSGCSADATGGTIDGGVLTGRIDGAMSGSGTTSGSSGMTSGASGMTSGMTLVVDDAGSICADAATDNACISCFKQSCCQALSNCEGDQACINCLAGTDASCISTNANATALSACQTSTCGAACAAGTSGSPTGACMPSAVTTPCADAIDANCCDKLTACNNDPTCSNCIQNGCSVEDETTVAFFACFCNQSACAPACQ